MVRINAKVTGNDRVIKALQRNPRTGLTAVSNVVKLNGSRMAQVATNRVPVRTGNLKRGIQLDTREDNGLTARLSAASVSYAKYVEWGTRKQVAQPFIGPAYNTVAPQFKNDLKRILGG